MIPTKPYAGGRQSPWTRSALAQFGPPETRTGFLVIDQLDVATIDLDLTVQARSLPRFDRPLEPSVRSMPLLNTPPWTRSLGKLGLEITTQGWRFPTPNEFLTPSQELSQKPQQPPCEPSLRATLNAKASRTRVRPSS